MPPIFLHHYPMSPFSEKVRLALGLKGLAWCSVEIPPAPPRPLLVPLTGGYRRTPVLQIGADIYCDTNIILPTLERLKPEPALYPPESAALAKALSFNFERSIWLPMIGVVANFIDGLPDAFLKDRKDNYLYVDISKAAMEPKLKANVQIVRAQLAWLAATLADGRRFLLGERASALDLGYFHPISLVRNNAPHAEVDALLGLAAIVPWYERVAALGHGQPSEVSADDALAAAREATPADVSYIAATRDGPRSGAKVRVTPDDFAKVPVDGTLVVAGDEEIVIHRTDAQAGDVQVHFPRAGFLISED
ncbi:Glutathione S-transferase [Beijerinckiaceae bacterium RH AL1]|nr:glutathione S-transferase family protein [Beijerinckiaceae bacterium]VVB48277.1 Glutathione S-transferase [Beijerinckiaceae bacterium RH CH11]VVB48358.1 Glutathione S-transferase [Beijerinckiaceae bacterium RH AL8]VVC56313.1 Glutathione S-transferase [Beijerinckiaceae bacterium RH AL1]